MENTAVLKRIIDLVKILSAEEQQQVLEFIEQKPSLERRQSRRRSVVIDVTYGTEDFQYRDFSKDISRTGISLKTARPRLDLKLGQQAVLRIPFSGRPAAVRVSGEIVRLTRHEIAFRFVDDPPAPAG